MKQIDEINRPRNEELFNNIHKQYQELAKIKTKDEQIKELARDIFEPRVAIDGIDIAFASVHGADRDNDTHFMRIARHLYDKGYRKTSDVAKEIFEEVDTILRNQFNKYETKSCEADVIEEIKQISRGTINDLWYQIAELKKKYTEVEK